jgi:co-chaperonin GroES (HSP10)
LKSFSGNVIELPPMLNQTAAGGSFASHKPFKHGQQQHGVAAAAAVAAADAEHGGSGAGSVGGCGFGSAASFAMYGAAGGSSSKHTLDTIPDPDEEDAEQQQGEVAAVSATATQAVAHEPLHVAAGDGLQLDSANTTDDDDVAEVAALVVPSPRKAQQQQQQQQQQGLGDISVHSDQQSKSGASAAGDEKEGSRSGKLIRAEERARGQVRKSVYMAYLLAMGPLLLLPIGVTLGECASGVVCYMVYCDSQGSCSVCSSQFVQMRSCKGCNCLIDMTEVFAIFIQCMSAHTL